MECKAISKGGKRLEETRGGVCVLLSLARRAKVVCSLHTAAAAASESVERSVCAKLQSATIFHHFSLSLLLFFFFVVVPFPFFPTSLLLLGLLCGAPHASARLPARNFCRRHAVYAFKN